MSLISKSIFLGVLTFLSSFGLQAQSDAVLKGKTLAESYCGSCHAYPSPSLLPKEVWKNQVLPHMAAFMGIQAAQDSLGIWENKSKEEIVVLKKLGTYPSSPQIEARDFHSIVGLYTTEAPEELSPQSPKATPVALQGFTPKKLFIEGIQSPKTSLVAINEARAELFIADAGTSQLYVKVQSDELFTLPSISSPAVHYLQKAPNVFNFITIGSIAPSDLSQGAVYEMDLNSDGWRQVLGQLTRPVYAAWEDIHADGIPDLLICNYGNHGGNISIFPDGDISANPLPLGGAGARKVEVHDLNQDGKLDIVALFCQGNERISVFYNNGNGGFEQEKILLRFSPVMGSSYFEMRDLNADGYLDLLVSNGDNWDYSSVRKPYHGYRIYQNKGKGTFEETWFYPQYGAAKAMTLDFDGDGDLDLATLSFYDELDDPQQQFLLFENEGNRLFVPQYVPDAALGKWLTMDVGDMDADGDQDIALGAYSHNTLEYTKILLRGVDEIPSVLILENDNLQKE